MKDLLKNITDKALTDPTAVDEHEPKGDEYRPVWLTAKPMSLDICMGPVLFNIAYPHILMTIAASEFYSAFWIITPSLTYCFEGENLKHVIRRLGDREARALYLFDPDIHKRWDEKKGRILRIQPVIASADAAFNKAAETFGISVGKGTPAAPEA